MCARVLITGGAGFLGRALATVLATEHEVRLFDVSPAPAPPRGEAYVGSVSDPSSVKKACAGMDALVIAHMAPNRPGVYDEPSAAFDVNVKGTALLFDAAVAAAIKRVVLVSTAGVLSVELQTKAFLSRNSPATPQSIYGLSKAVQEVIAAYYHRTAGLPVAVLRPASIIDEGTLKDKYGNPQEAAQWHFVDPRDIGGAALAALRLPDLGYEVFYLCGPAEADRHADVAHARTRLKWQPQHDFSRWP